jgi:hypothetical protein
LFDGPHVSFPVGSTCVAEGLGALEVLVWEVVGLTEDWVVLVEERVVLVEE